MFLVALVLAAVLALAMPETRAAPPVPTQTCERAPARRGRLSAAATGALVAFAAFGLFTALAPSFLVGTLLRPSLILAGASSFAVVAVAPALLRRDAPAERADRTAPARV